MVPQPCHQHADTSQHFTSQHDSVVTAWSECGMERKLSQLDFHCEKNMIASFLSFEGLVSPMKTYSGKSCLFSVTLLKISVTAECNVKVSNFTALIIRCSRNKAVACPRSDARWNKKLPGKNNTQGQNFCWMCLRLRPLWCQDVQSTVGTMS